MATTPVKVTKHAANENLTPVQPWSRTKGDRFGGYNSMYAAPGSIHAAPLSPSRGNSMSSTPRKKSTKEATPVADRYATPSERLGTPSKPKPSSTFTSATDRFALPGSLYTSAKTATPGVGSYTPAELAAKVQGAVKLQAAVRRRQSRGAFAHLFTTPGVGEYDLARKVEGGDGASSKPSAVFRSTATRFEGHGSIYKEAVAADAELSTEAHRVDTTAAVAERDTTTAAFRNAVARDGPADRFAGPGSLYTKEATSRPGMGDYDAPAAKDYIDCVARPDKFS